MQTRQKISRLSIVVMAVIGLVLSGCQVQMVSPPPVDEQLEANKAVVARFYDEIWNQGKYAVADEIIAPDFISRVTGNEGPDAIKNVVTLWRTAFPEMEITFEIIAAEGDIVVTQITNNQGAYAGGLPPFFGVPDSAIGTESVTRGVDFARIKDGQYVEAWIQHDDLGWIEQFGFELQPVAE